MHVTAERVVSTGRGCKILVPREQTIDDDHLDELLAVAAQQKAAPKLERTSFTASAGVVAPGRRLRYALLAPRLVAPHRNAGYDAPITPEEAVALCAQGRFLDLQRFSEQHNSVPDPRQPYNGRDWRWSFVRAFWTWGHEDDVAGLTSARAAAPTTETKAAAGVLLSCALLRVDRVAEAHTLLDDLLAEDDLGPVDHGWVLVQRARLRTEVGDVTGARADAVNAQRQFPGDEDDPTVSVLAAAAAWLLFSTAGLGAGDLAGTLTVADTAIAWWRSQTISWALSQAADRAFQAWAHDTTTRWAAEDLEAVHLYAAELGADLAGEHGTWRSVCSLAARQMLMRTHAFGDAPAVVGSLDALRRSGDHASMKLALGHLRRVGPVVPLVQSLHRITTESWTHTAAQTNLKVLAIAGEFAPESLANAWIEMLLEVLRSPAEFAGRVRPSFMLNLAAIEAIDGLLPAASFSARRSAAEYLAEQCGPIDPVVESGLTGWIRAFVTTDLSDDIRDGLRQLASGDRGRVGAAVLGKLADCDDREAKEEVLSRALNGDLNALSAMGDVTVLTADQAAGLVQRFELMVRHTVERAERSEWGFGGFDAGRGLALFNIWFPNIARWDPLLELLEHDAVVTDDKRGALELIVDVHERVPEEVLSRLAGARESIARSPAFAEVGGRSVDALATGVAVVGGRLMHDAADVAVTHLALGAEQDRCGAAALLGRGWCERMRPLLAADGRVPVRRAAAEAVGRLAGSSPDAVVVELARRLVRDGGAIVPSALLVGLSRGDQETELGREIAASLSDHASARVRRLAREFPTH